MDQEVLVLDQERRFLQYTHPAVARRLLKEGKATVYSKVPFAIQLNKSVVGPNRTRTQEDIMARDINFTEFFKEERDIYVQNVSNCQVSVSFEIAPGRAESHLFTNTRDPINLTRYIPFNAIKTSIELRRMVTRIPSALQILTEDEFNTYYAGAAKSKNLKNTDAAIAEADARAQAVRNHQPLPDAKEQEPSSSQQEDSLQRNAQSNMVSEEDAINPRILNLCLQVHPSVPDQQKMSAQQLLSELDTISGLTLLDWEYLQSHGYYKSVRNLARKKVAELAAAEARADDEEDEVPVKKAKKPAKKNKHTTTNVDE